MKQTKPQNNFYLLTTELWRLISLRRRYQFCMLLILMVIASVAEVFSMGAVIPFLAAISNPEKVYQYTLLQPFIDFFNLTSSSELLLLLTILFITSVLIAAVIRFILLWVNTTLSFSTGHDLSVAIYKQVLYQPYQIHISRNSSEVIDAVIGKASNIVYQVIWPLCNLISCAFILSFLIVALFYINPFIALVSFGGFGFFYFLMIKFTKKKILSDGVIISSHTSLLIKSLQEGLGSIRDILLDGTQDLYKSIYEASDKSLRKAQGDSFFVGMSPRFGIEALGMILIALIAFAMVNSGKNSTAIIPVLGAFALGAQRILPLLQQSFNAWSNMQGAKQTLQDTLKILNVPSTVKSHKNTSDVIKFQKEIQLKNISFKYNQSGLFILNKINLSIKKGDRIGLIGRTGSGKSTLLDILMGLLIPTTGEIKIDNKKITSSNRQQWQKRIAHVPQSIFLIDASIAENIAFGIPKEFIDLDRVEKSALDAQIHKDITSWPSKFQAIVGERGVKLSGGQRQRIALARALYKNADVIILDEATSALDMQTERMLMSKVDQLAKNLTIIMISHRIASLKNCDKIFELNEGSLKPLKSRINKLRN